MKRLDYLDNIAGILICYMMLMHILLWKTIPLDNNSLWLEPLKFFMFWFFFKSGMFYRMKSTRECAIRGGKKLIYPFVVFSILGYVIHISSIYFSGDRNWIHYILTPIKEFVIGGSIGGNDVLWFLTSLFMVQVLFNELMVRNIKIPYVAIGGVIIAYLCHILYIDKPAYLANVALGISMYSLGYIWKERQFSAKLAIFAVVIYIIIMLLDPSHIDLRTNALYGNGIYILAIAFSLAGCIVINNVFHHLPKIPIINYVGRESMAFYVTHMLVLELLMMIPFEQIGVSGGYVFGIMCLSCLFVPFLLKKFMPDSIWHLK